MTPEFERAVIREILTLMDRPDWRLLDTGNGILIGPNGFAVIVTDTEGGDTHVDIWLQLPPRRSQRKANPEAPIIWDCVLGHFADVDASAVEVVNAWHQSAYATVAQLYDQGGTHAVDMHGSEPEGMPGWHVILSPIQGYGEPESEAEVLGRWLADNPILPALAPAFAQSVDPGTAPHGAKILIGGSPEGRVAEVRIAGVVNPDISAALDALAWPTPAAPAVARVYALFVHQEHGHDSDGPPDEDGRISLVDRVRSFLGRL